MRIVVQSNGSIQVAVSAESTSHDQAVITVECNADPCNYATGIMTLSAAGARDLATALMSAAETIEPMRDRVDLPNWTAGSVGRMDVARRRRRPVH